jgi:SAM-dependent methyltransferase
MTVYTQTIVDVFDGLPADARVLEVGSGGRRIDPRVVSLEIDWSPEIDVTASVLELPFSDDSFDFVFSQAVLEHVTDPPLAMREMIRVLKPGGVFHCVAAFMQPLHLEPIHFFNFTPYGMELMVRDLLEDGYEVEAWGSLADTFKWWADELKWGHKIVRAMRTVDSLLSPERAWKCAANVQVTGRKPCLP